MRRRTAPASVGRAVRLTALRLTALRQAAAALALGGLAACATTGAQLPYQPVPRLDPASTSDAVPTPPSATAGCNPRASVTPLPVLPPAGQRGPRIAAIEERGQLRVGVVAESPPFASMNWHSGKPEGFEVAIAHELADAILGDPGLLEVRAVDTRDRAQVLNAGDIDVIVGTMTMTCERKELVNFSGVYFEAAFRVLVPKNAGLDTVADLSGRRVCSSQGSTSAEKVRNLPGFPADVRKPVPVTRVGSADCLAALQRGEVDAVATDDAILTGMVREDPTVKVLGIEAFPDAGAQEIAELDEPYGMAVARTDLPLRGTAKATAIAADEQFVAYVNRVLLDMMRGPRWQQLYDTYLGAVLDRGYRSPLVIQPNWPDGEILPQRATPAGSGP